MRRSILLTGVLASSLALSACGSSGNSTSDTPNPDASSPAADAAGVFTMWVDEVRINDVKGVVETFAEESGVEVNLVQKASGDIREEFVQQAQTGEGPDVIIGASDWLGELVSNGLVAPVELGDAASGFVPSAATAFAYDGQNYGTPYAIENIALVRNNALATETPDTFDALVEQGKGLGTYPVLIQQGAEGDPYHMYPIQSSFGAIVFEQNADGSYTDTVAMGGEAGTNFANFLQKMGQEKVFDTAIDGEKAKQAFLDGQSPYIITGPWNTTAFTEAGLDISVLPIPSAGGEVSRPFVGVQGAYVSAFAKNPVLANEFVANYLTSEAAQDALYEAGGRSPALAASAAKVEDPILVGFGEAGADGMTQPSIPAMASVWSFWGIGQAEIISGAATDPAAAWTTMISNIEAAIAGS